MSSLNPIDRQNILDVLRLYSQIELAIVLAKLIIKNILKVVIRVRLDWKASNCRSYRSATCGSSPSGMP